MGQFLGVYVPPHESAKEAEIETEYVRLSTQLGWNFGGYHLVMTNIAMENHHF